MEKKEELQCCVDTNGVKLTANFWDKQYQNKETNWDLKGVSPPLKSYIDSISEKNLYILIPGCGNAYEAEYLLDQGFTNVTVIDISPALVKTLTDKFINKKIQIIQGDFFEHQGKYELILEQTFFCAIEPSLRPKYVNQCFNLLSKNGIIAGLLFNIEFEKAGPPFGGKKEDYQKLFDPLFNRLQFDTCTNSIKPREGNELFVELQKKVLPFEETLI